VIAKYLNFEESMKSLQRKRAQNEEHNNMLDIYLTLSSGKYEFVGTTCKAIATLLIYTTLNIAQTLS